MLLYFAFTPEDLVSECNKIATTVVRDLRNCQNTFCPRLFRKVSTTDQMQEGEGVEVTKRGISLLATSRAYYYDGTSGPTTSQSRGLTHHVSSPLLLHCCWSLIAISIRRTCLGTILTRPSTTLGVQRRAKTHISPVLPVFKELYLFTFEKNLFRFHLLFNT